MQHKGDDDASARAPVLSRSTNTNGAKLQKEETPINHGSARITTEEYVGEDEI